ncbi:MAG: hypothetical protein NVSMB55_00560 [Mycobacteriales bacterium]
MPTVRQRIARAKEQQRHRRLPDPEAAAARIAAYVPLREGAKDSLPLIRDLVTRTGPVDAADASELLSALSNHAGFLANIGTPVTAETLLDPAYVQRWALTALDGLSAGSGANYRSRIARIDAAVNGNRRPAPLYTSDPTEPYTPDEEDLLITWASGLRTASLRLDMLVALCLGLGCGLSTAEIVETAADDVTTTGPLGLGEGRVLVRAHAPRPRIVPVRERYEGLVDDLAASVGTGSLFAAGTQGRLGKNALSNRVAAALALDPSVPKITGQRMRATWIVGHLDMGVRADALLPVAGLDDLGSLDRYLRWTRPLSLLDAVATVAGSGA